VNNNARYDNLSIALHWATAVLVLLQFGLAEIWEFFPRPTRHLMIMWHMSFGLMLAAVIVLRILWRFMPGHKMLASGQGILRYAANLVHYTLYVLIVAEMPLGVFTRWTDNKVLSFFGLLMPSPFGSFSKAAGHITDEMHNINAWLIIILAGSHALAALLHHYLLRDNTLRRMLPLRTAA
jgi:cytochrome b561